VQLEVEREVRAEGVRPRRVARSEDSRPSRWDAPAATDRVP
jgi:hypothetical protein